MNRRQRHLRIIENFGSYKHDSHVRFHFNATIHKLGLDALTDQAIELFTRNLVESRARQAKMNTENRKQRASRPPP